MVSLMDSLISQTRGAPECVQGAWRMRGIARGQTLEAVLPEDLAVPMRSILQDLVVMQVWQNVIVTTKPIAV